MTAYWAYRSASGLSRRLPLTWAYRLGTLLADFYWLIDRSGRRSVSGNLRQIHDHVGRPLTRVQTRRLTRQVYRNFAKYLVDFFRFESISGDAPGPAVRIENQNYLQACAESGRGTIVVTAHFGNWELGGAVLAGLGYELIAVVLPYRSRRIEQLFNHYRESRGIHTIPAEHAPRQLMHYLGEGAMVALLADRDFTGHQHNVSFFGRMASMPRGPAWLAIKTGCAILPAFMIRQADNSFVLRLHPPLRPQELKTDERIRDRLAEILEEEIAENPDQWFIFEDMWDIHHGERQQRG